VARRTALFFLRQRLLSRFRVRLLRLSFLMDDLACGLKKYLSWFSAVHASFPVR
jgi:hypothetical protein